MNEAHRILVKQVVYDEFMKPIRTVRHSFNTTGTANYRIQLAVPPSTIDILTPGMHLYASTNNDHNHNNIVFKKS